MPSWDLGEIVQHTHGTLLSGIAQQQVQGVSTDSRTVQPGELFVALRGERFDGHHFVRDAVQQGATAILVSESPAAATDLVTSDGAPVAVIRVNDTEKALQDFALAHRRRFRGTMVAITGSNGKTTVKEMTAAVLSTSFATYKASGNLNNHLGVPLTLLGMALTQHVAVLELGMNHLGEIRRLCEIALPHIGVITNIGLAHVGHLGSIERIQQAKGELIEALDASGVAIVNADDPRALWLGQHSTAGRVMTFGQGPEAEVRGWVQQDRGLEGLRCALVLQQQVWDVQLRLPGMHQLPNALAAAAVGVAMQVPAGRIVEALEGYKGMYGRMTVRRGRHGGLLIDDTYNANPQSMQAALQCLARVQSPGQHIAVLGDMLELGAAAPALHQEIGALAAHSGVHHLIVFGPLATHMAQGAEQAGLAVERIHHASNQQEVLTALASVVHPQDVVLLKGSRGMAMEHLVHALGAATEGQ
jgi:UDP-N-acetylmuramoyl-tripeptide--D-alanyl-D-alanine ligase